MESFVRCYGREPMPVDAIDAGSVTRLSAPALDLVLDHLDAAERAGRPVPVRRSPVVERLLDAAADRGGSRGSGGAARAVRPSRVPEGMADDIASPDHGNAPAPVGEEIAPPLSDDPRIPRIEDADPSMSKELGGAAPAVGPKASDPEANE